MHSLLFMYHFEKIKIKNEEVNVILYAVNHWIIHLNNWSLWNLVEKL